jgi:hypothetical protein
VGHTELAFGAGPGEAAPSISRARARTEQGPRPPRGERLEQTTMLEAALLAPPLSAAPPAPPLPAREATPRCPSCDAPLPVGAACCHQCGAAGPGGPRVAAVAHRAMTLARTLLALALLLAGVLMVTGVLLARERGLLGRRTSAAWQGREAGPRVLEGVMR